MTEDDLHRCLWALPGKHFALVIKALQASPSLRALVISRQHNFVPVLCLPPNSTVPVLRSRVALPRKHKGILRPNVLQVQVSTCAPVAIYGETQISLSAQGCAYNFLTTPEIGVVKASDLLDVERAVIMLLHSSAIEILTREMTAKPLPDNMKVYSLETYLDALFMQDDYPY